MASYKIRTAGNCLLSFLLSGLCSILESNAGTRCRYDCCRRNHSPLRQRKVESDAEVRCRHRCCRRNRFPSRQRRTESDAEGRCSDGRSRRNHSPLRQRKLESDAEGRCSDGRSWRAILHRHDDYAASIRKSGPEIRNQCTQEGLNGKNLHRFASSGLKSRIDARKRG